jgi:hypothetical protein
MECLQRTILGLQTPRACSVKQELLLAVLEIVSYLVIGYQGTKKLGRVGRGDTREVAVKPTD